MDKRVTKFSQQHLSVLKSFLFLFLVFVLGNCQPQQTLDSQSHAANSSRLFKSTKRFVVKVSYMPDARPFVGDVFRGRPAWDILEENILALLQFSPAIEDVVVPKTIEQMTRLPDNGRRQWSTQDILDARPSSGFANSEEVHLDILFLNGRFVNEQGEVMSRSSGVSVRGRNTIAIFKDVIRGSRSGFQRAPGLARFIEQSSLVHECGHAFGLTNIGIPAQSDHEDPFNPGHTRNPRAVMYFQNEGRQGLRRLSQQVMRSNSLIMWGPETLEDVRAFTSRQ